MKYFNCLMSSSLFSSFQENTKCESSFFADTCTRRVAIFLTSNGSGEYLIHTYIFLYSSL